MTASMLVRQKVARVGLALVLAVVLLTGAAYQMSAAGASGKEVVLCKRVYLTQPPAWAQSGAWDMKDRHP